MFGQELLGNGLLVWYASQIDARKKASGQDKPFHLNPVLFSSTSLHDTFYEQAIQMSCSMGKDISYEKAYRSCILNSAHTN